MNASVLQGLSATKNTPYASAQLTPSAATNQQTRSMLSRVNDDDEDDNDDNDENYHPRARSFSTGSDDTDVTGLTECTSATEVRETASVCTVKKGKVAAYANSSNVQQTPKYISNKQ